MAILLETSDLSSKKLASILDFVVVDTSNWSLFANPSRRLAKFTLVPTAVTDNFPKLTPTT